MNIPEKLYVARTFVSADEVRGYIIDATKDHTKAYQTKKDRVDGYARNKTLPALTLDNVPTTGFAVVQRLDTYGRETYFTIRHPEGFEFQVSARNMMDLIGNNDIHKGVFVDPMYFNSNLELINGKTATFAKMQKKQEDAEKRKEVISSLKVGDGFKWGKNEYYYAGRVHAICPSKTKEYSIVEKSKQYHLIYNITDNGYILNDKLDNYDFVPSALLNKKTTMEQEIVLANQYFQQTVSNKYLSPGASNYPVLIHNKSFKKKDMKIKYEEVNGSCTFKPNIVYKCTLDDQDYRVFFGLSSDSGRNSGYYSYRRSDFTVQESTSAPFDYYCTYPVQILENGQMEMDVDLNEHTSFSTWRGYKSPFYPPTQKYSPTGNYTDKAQMPRIEVHKVKLYVGRYYL